MKSVGEVMAIGRTFQESLQKALRGLETGKVGLDPTGLDLASEDGMAALRREVKEAGPERVFHLADAFRAGMSVEDVFGLRSEEHTSELQSLMRISYAVFCLKKKKHNNG